MEFLGLVLENKASLACLVPGQQLWLSILDHGHVDTVGVPLT